MTDKIKVNDFVYIPSTSKGVHKVYFDNDGKLTVDDNELRHNINELGYRYDYSLGWLVERPFAFLATPENKIKLEVVYGELADIPIDEGLENFTKVLNQYTNLIASQSDNQDLEAGLYSQLVMMFKERGIK